mmetsp:Transcript_9277/g.17477  ORF Transcript_9277/g.17477 Transcript_9277/m.17477 type:complete len:597 (+) Transcript_9277:208-1998(+)
MRKNKILLCYLFRQNLGCLNACYGVSYLLCSLVAARSLLVDVHSFSWWRRFHPNPVYGLQEHPSSFITIGSSSWTTLSFLSGKTTTATKCPSKILGMAKLNLINEGHLPMVLSTASEGNNAESSYHRDDFEKQNQVYYSSSRNNRSSNHKQKTPYHRFRHPMSNTTLYGCGISISQFKSWVRYKMQSSSQQTDVVPAMQSNEIMNFISTETIDASEPSVRDRLRMKWISRKLLVDKTEVFSKFSSSYQNTELENSALCKDKECMSTSDKQEQERIVWEKRGKFEDLLKGYVQRIIDIIRDETRDRGASLETYKSIPFNLVDWLEKSYDSEKVQQLKERNFRQLAILEQKEAMMDLLQWFRTMFPYYYDRCEHCGASYRLDATSEVIERDEICNKTLDLDEKNNKTEEDSLPTEGPFLGFCYPEPHEQLGRAARTELFECRSCGRYTRFPRYNSVKHIVDSRRGRCGEYSILLYRMLRALGHEARWVVDWADHVWVECWIGGDWIHLDPCEAALDRPLLYREWGKKQTFIIAFWAPLRSGEASIIQDYITDVTLKYTSDGIAAISKRRHIETEVVNDIIRRSASLLCNQLRNVSVVE